MVFFPTDKHSSEHSPCVHTHTHVHVRVFDLKIIIIIIAEANEIPDRSGKMNEKNKGLFSIHPAGIVLKTNPAEKAIIQRQVFMDKPHLLDIIQLVNHGVSYTKQIF